MPEELDRDTKAIRFFTEWWEIQLTLSIGLLAGLLYLAFSYYSWDFDIEPRLQALLALFHQAIVSFSAGFLLHIGLRGLWMAAVTLKNFAPESIDWKKIGFKEYYTKFLDKDSYRLESVIANLDRWSDIAFIASFMMFYFFLVFGFVIMVISFILSSLFDFTPIVSIVLVAFLTFLYLINTALLFILKRITIKPFRWLGYLSLKMNMFLGTIFLFKYFKIFYLYIRTIIKPYYFLIALVGISFFTIQLTSIIATLAASTNEESQDNNIFSLDKKLYFKEEDKRMIITMETKVATQSRLSGHFKYNPPKSPEDSLKILNEFLWVEIPELEQRFTYEDFIPYNKRESIQIVDLDQFEKGRYLLRFPHLSQRIRLFNQPDPSDTSKALFLYEQIRQRPDSLYFIIQ